MAAAIVPLDRGRRLAEALAAGWQQAPPGSPPPPFADLIDVLRRSGEAGLVWRRVRGTPAAAGKAVRGLRDEYRGNVIVAHRARGQLALLFPALRAAGVEPILVKGWGVARLYPEPGLRPITDHDLCVPPPQFEAASRVIAHKAEHFGTVDLHEGVTDLPDRSFATLLDRSQLIPIDNTPVRVLGPEDQLRLVALHAWRHHFARPLNLCDLGLLAENLPPDFDWAYFRSGDRVQTAWALAALELTHRLLGARIPWPADLAGRVRLPGWLIPAVLYRWGVGTGKPAVGQAFRRPGEFVNAVRHHWLNPVKVCYRLRVPPRWPYAWVQLLGLAARPEEMLARLARHRRGPDRSIEHGYAAHPADISRYC